MTFEDILQRFRTESFTEREKGSKFEKLIRRWLLSDPKYSNMLEHVWLWNEFPAKDDFGGKDVGIDLVAQTDQGEYWAIQCKCYDENAVINKPAVDSFIATAHRTFKDVLTFQTRSFSNLIWVATTSHWGPNAEETLKNQTIPVTRINQYELKYSSVDWEKLVNGKSGKEVLLGAKQTMDHQKKAIDNAHKYYKDHDRGKLIMACGTGKTYTSLKIVENETEGNGLVLYMVPSIALLGQGLNNWMTDTSFPMKGVCVCSDSKSSKINNDDDETSIIDIPLPATTNIKTIAKQLLGYRKNSGLTVVFSTYQSIDVISEAQKKVLESTNGAFGQFDFIVCDEAHRTTGAKAKSKEESNFTKIHNNDFIKGKKRLYMTATPRYYNSSAKATAKEKELLLWSMDNPTFYGDEFYRIGFGEAVSLNLLTDYKVLVLTISEDDIPADMKEKLKAGKKEADGNEFNSELNFDDTSKLLGCINGLSKRIKGDNGITKKEDPGLMHRVVAFCSTIRKGKRNSGFSSMDFADEFPSVAKYYKEHELTEEEKKEVVDVEVKHIDGSMNAEIRSEAIDWLKAETGHPNECRVLSNVRCLSEGVDVPALDAVIFVTARDSQVDIVQSVGRVMRSFHKGQPDEKKYGYIIIPVVIPTDADPNLILNDNSNRFKVVWDILNALRAHDEEFNATVNKINLNKTKPSKITIAGIPRGQFGMRDGDTGSSLSNGEYENESIEQPSQEDVSKQLEIRFGEMQDAIYARMVEKVGDRLYWENWAAKVGDIAHKFINRINGLIQNGSNKKEFEKFLQGLQQNLNPSVDTGQAIEMLAQHLITRPVFDALFEDYEFVKNNPVSRSMEKMLEMLEGEAFEKDTEVLQSFYEDVRINVGEIDNLEGKQTIIKTLYEKFFKGAFPLTVEKLGIVYTPVECVDFILHSVNDILKKEFACCLSDENVHILDPFVGTGTFITRLMQSGLIKKEDLERKYLNEIHCNEIVLLAYYIADVNIESVFHEITHRKEYLPYDGICLTDTFQTTETPDNVLDKTWFPENATNVEKQRKAPIRVIIGNPPYSIGQKAANDNAQNQSYANLDSRIMKTYVKESAAGLNKSTYDLYIKAFRWASDKLNQNKDGGIIGFISNGAWIDGNANDGFRKCLEKEFSSIYVLNLRGNARTSGELRRKEGDGIFGIGSRTPIAITLLVKKLNQTVDNKAAIYYHDIGDYLTREQKLKMVKDFASIETNKFDWTPLYPNEHGDWISMRNEGFSELIPLAPEKKFDKQAKSLFVTFAIGLASNRDSWVYNFSKSEVENNMKRMIDFYNEQKEGYKIALLKDSSLTIENFIDTNQQKISWTVNLIKYLEKGLILKNNQCVRNSLYRPFCKSSLYFDNSFIERPGLSHKLFPTPDTENLVICLSGVGASKPFSTLISNCIPDLQLMFNGQCFPLYYYEKNEHKQLTLFDDENANDYIRHDGISDWILKEVRNRFGGTRKITKETIFYYVYGLLHSPEYRETFAADLKKSLPRIPIIDDIDAFLDFSFAGKALAELHLNYENVKPYEGVRVIDGAKSEPTGIDALYNSAAEAMATYTSNSDYQHYAVNKMRFPQKGRKDTLIYNDYIRIENIPAEAYEYIVNGKSAIEWLMERYAVTVDKASMIKNDPNDWSREHHKPRYILDLVLSVINVSVQTVALVKRLPKLHFEGSAVTIVTPGNINISEFGGIEKEEQETSFSSSSDTLYLPIKQVYFDEIIAGTKKIEYREIKTTTASKYLAVDAKGNVLCDPKNTVEGTVYFLNDYNNGKFPFVAKAIKRLKLVVGYNANRDEALVEVNDITFSAEDIRAGKFATWWTEFHLGKIIEVKRKR